MQDVAHDALQTLGSDLKETKDKALRAKIAQSMSALCKAFDTLEDRKRILNGKPMPGSLRPEAKARKRPRNYGTLRVVESDAEQADAGPTLPTKTEAESKESLIFQPPTGTEGGKGV